MGEILISWVGGRDLAAQATDLSSPVDFGDIYLAAEKALKRLSAEPENRLYILLSPGTPAMQAVWLLLGKTRFSATFWQSSPEQGVERVEVPFDISAEYIPAASGIPRALRGWPRIDLIDDVGGNQFSAVTWRPEAEWGRAGEVMDQVIPPVATLLELLAEAGNLSNADIRERLNLKDRTHVRQHYIDPALARGLIEYTIPDKPNSRMQKYRLTAAGRTWLRNRSNRASGAASG